MKLSKSFFYTIREDVRDEDSTSGNLLVRAGYIKKSSSGVYMYMPLGLKVKNKIENIIREEMNAIDAQEMTMPTLIPEDVYVASGRRDIIGTSMFQLDDRFKKPFVLGPTHEELFAQAAQMKIRSYKDMPFSLYQFQTKFRDEARPRFGLIRVREFVMKDSYTFDTDLESADKSYDAMFEAYKRIFDRVGLDYRIVRADTGIMGGLLSEEFQAVTDIGEDILVLGEETGYSSNLEVAENVNRIQSDEPFLSMEKVYTPNARTIEEVASFLQQPVQKFVKTLIYRLDDQYVAVCVLGDRDVNETKLAKLYKATEVELADFENVQKHTGASVGFAGPVGLEIDVVVDKMIEGLRNFTVGANENDHHFINVNHSDFKATHIIDVSNVKEGDPNPDGKGVLTFSKGIEVGNTFKLGTKYSKAMGLEYLDQNNKLQDVYMGSYGIGLGRTLAAVVEQNNDENGIVWPMNLAPFQVAIVVINNKNEEHMAFADDLYQELTQAGLEVILDDRKQRPGIKFNDMDLIGVPLRITVGRDVEHGEVELKERKTGAEQKIKREDILSVLKSYM
ncbi:proline--tRNA ligase [Erysipelothrix piscisicarius]|uniref:Proline--tRNA ligase n=1 Tax=Erysipelothrix piscisicarius TaxID=2485784 RepID=A0A3Q8S7V2_9FIRM|nr:proline--tRNA ligase [Erysipelothrix piscisicarius]AZK44455.1 proline--tRNA ligase [Erysipelothrix piscisicarius]